MKVCDWCFEFRDEMAPVKGTVHGFTDDPKWPGSRRVEFKFELCATCFDFVGLNKCEQVIREKEEV